MATTAKAYYNFHSIPWVIASAENCLPPTLLYNLKTCLGNEMGHMQGMLTGLNLEQEQRNYYFKKKNIKIPRVL